MISLRKRKFVSILIVVALISSIFMSVGIKAEANSNYELYTISTSGNHSVAIKTDGTVWSWGNNFYGQLGDGTFTDSSLPVQVKGISNVISVSANGFNTLALKSDGTVWVWGWFWGENRLEPYKINGLSNIVSIYNGDYHAVALKSDGTLWAWGSNTVGDLGNGTSFTESLTPLKVPRIPKVVSMFAGNGFTFVTDINGEVWSWGYAGTGGLLGLASNAELQAGPMKSTTMINSYATGTRKYEKVVVGSSHAMGLKSNNVYSWGYGSVIGNSSDYYGRDMQVTSLSNVVDIAAGNKHSVALKSDGTVWTWGANDKGQLGREYITSEYITTPGSVNINNVVAITSKYDVVLALKSDGTLWSWGNNYLGQLGDGTKTNSLTPVQVSGISNILINGADTEPPLPATFTVDKTTPTNGNVTVTINYPSDAAIKQYKIGTSGTWMNYTNPISITENGVVYARSSDEAGNVSIESNITISNIDKTPPALATFVLDKTEPTNTDIKVTITYPSDASTKQYKFGASGTWMSYTTPVVVTSNNTVYARSIDAAGNVSTESNIVVSNIDKTPPVAATLVADKTTPTNTDVKVTITFPSDATTKQYKIGSGVWTNYIAPVVITANNSIYARSIDVAGNISAESSIVVNNIDKTSPVAATLVADKTNPTNTDVKVAITYPSDATVKQYKVGESGTWSNYTVPVVVTANNTVYARSIDAAGNTSVESNLVVNNIDKTAPTSPSATITGNKLVIIPGTDANGVDKTLYQLNNGQWIEYSNTVTLPYGEYEIKIKTIDKAGNESQITTVIETVIDWDIVNKAVASAESIPTQTKVDAAQVLVNKLPSSVEKDALQKRLDAIQTIINKYNIIQDEIDEMNDNLNRGNATLVTIDEYEDRVEELRNLVVALPNTMNKTSLNKQLDELLVKLALVKKVLSTGVLSDDGSYEEVDLGEIQDEIDNLPDGDLKDQLQEHFEQAKDLQDAISKVEKAEQTKSQADANSAKDAVNKLPDGQVKNDLNTRLDEVQKQIDDAKKLEQQIADATQKVVKAEGSKLQNDVDSAKEAVNKLPDGQVKNDLNTRLDEVEKEINANDGTAPYTDIELIKDSVAKTKLLDVERYVKLAEKYKTRTYIVMTLEKVEALPESIISNPLYSIIVEDLTARADKVKTDYNNGIAEQELQAKITSATNAVTQYEKYRSAYYKNRAQTAVDALPNGEVKETLQNRIQAVISK